MPKIGLALGSGGAKGLSHIGVLRAFERHGIQIDGIAGSSIGALVGAHYAAFQDAKKLEEQALSLTSKTGFSIVDPVFKGGLLRGKKAEVLIRTMLDGAAFGKLKIPYAAVATDFETAAPVVLKDGDLVKAIRASLSVPAFFQPLHYNNRYLADGGLSDPVPVDILRNMGMDLVIAVNLDTLYISEVSGKLPPLTRVPIHSINILRHHLAMHSTKTADVRITPVMPYRIDLVGLNYFFNTQKVHEIIEAGEKAAEEKIPELKKMINAWGVVKKEKDILSRLYSFFRRR